MYDFIAHNNKVGFPCSLKFPYTFVDTIVVGCFMLLLFVVVIVLLLLLLLCVLFLFLYCALGAHVRCRLFINVLLHFTKFIQHRGTGDTEDSSDDSTKSITDDTATSTLLTLTTPAMPTTENITADYDDIYETDDTSCSDEIGATVDGGDIDINDTDDTFYADHVL